MYEETLKHNTPQSLIRRPSGLTDAEWDWLIVEALGCFMKLYNAGEQTSFLWELINVMQLSHNDAYKPILKSLGIVGDKSYQNMEHCAYRFFRHFCSEDFRNAIGHAGMKYARLNYDGKRFLWSTELEFKVSIVTDILSSIGAVIGSHVKIIASGENDVDEVHFICNQQSFDYYEKGRTKQFGDTMYYLKKTIIENMPKGKNKK